MQSNRIQPVAQNAALPGGNGHLPSHLKINDICYVGSHNSGCSKSYGWIYAQHTNSITQQIEQNGARYFKIPLHWFDPQNGCCAFVNLKGTNKPFIAIAHESDGKSNCRLSILQRGFRFPKRAIIIFEELAQAAKKYPKEIFILKVESYLMIGRTAENNTANYSKEQVTAFFEELLVNSGLKELAFSWTKVQQIPDLNDLRQGKNVIIFSDDLDFMTDNPQLTSTFFAYDYLCQTNWTDKPLSSIFSPELSRYTKDANGEIQQPFFEAHFNPEASLSMRSYSYLYNTYSQAHNRFQQLSKFYNKQVNFLTSDYIDQGQLSSLVDDLNKEIISKKEIQIALREQILKEIEPVQIEQGRKKIDTASTAGQNLFSRIQSQMDEFTTLQG